MPAGTLPVHKADTIPATTAFANPTNQSLIQATWVRAYRAAYEDLGKDVPSEAEAAAAAKGRL